MEKITPELLKETLHAIIENSDREPISLYQSIFRSNEEIFKYFFEKLITHVEGFACSTDKARFIASRMVKTLGTGEYLPLKETYNEYYFRINEDIPEYFLDKAEEYTYWSSKSIETTKEAFELFWKFMNNIKFKEIS